MKLGISRVSLLVVVIASCSNNTSNSENNNTKPDTTSTITPTINYNPVNVYPHDTGSFTEGFLMHEGKLYESTGATPQLPQTRSLFGVVNLKTGTIDKKIELDKKLYFGEGIAFFKNKIYQLTYKTKIGFVYDAKTFKQLSTFTFPSTEGWGMTIDSADLIMSDGTDILTWLDPVTLKPVKTISVTDEKGPVLNVNELEFINGFIYANVYGTDLIVKIDPATGKVKGRLDLTSVVNMEKNKFPGTLEMNGIAYDPATDKIYVTGKMWPHIYEIQFEH